MSNPIYSSIYPLPDDEPLEIWDAIFAPRQEIFWDERLRAQDDV